MNQVRLYGKPIRVNKASADKQRSVEVGAELFVGNLDPMVDERILYDTFSRFGTLLSAPKVARDESNLSKCYGFVSFADFDASDDAIANMNGQYLMNKEVSVQYAYKKDGKGERHGDQAERMLASQAKAHGVQVAPSAIPVGQMFSAAAMAPPPSAMGVMPAGFMSAPPPRAMPNGNLSYNPAPLQSHPRPPPPPSAPLSAAPTTGLPARPPTMNAGYGGPQGFLPPGFSNPPPGFPAGPPNGAAPPPAPPAGFPGALPPGFGPPAGVVGGGAPPPPMAPPAFQPYTRR